MSTTLVEQVGLDTGHHASQSVSGSYHVHSWRPWMSLYGLRLRASGHAQSEVCQLLHLVTLSSCLEVC